MSYARTVHLRFKPGMRNEALKLVDRLQEYAQDPKGFLGAQVLLPNDPDKATLITIWDSEEAREGSRHGILQDVLDGFDDLLDGPPEIKDQEFRDLGPGIIQTSVWTT